MIDRTQQSLYRPEYITLDDVCDKACIEFTFKSLKFILYEDFVILGW